MGAFDDLPNVATQGSGAFDDLPDAVQAAPAPPFRTDPAVLAPGAPQPRSPLGSFLLGVQNAGAGAGNIAGMPVDLATMAVNAPIALGTKAYNLAVPDEWEVRAPLIENPALGGNAIRSAFGNAAQTAGYPVMADKDLTPVEKIFSRMITMGTEALGTGAAARTLSQFARPESTTQKVLESLTPKTTGGAVVDTAGGLGAGAGQATAETFIPDNPIAQFFATLAGGTVGARTAQVAAAPRSAVAAIERTLPDSKTGTMRGTADAVARFMQENTTNLPKPRPDGAPPAPMAGTPEYYDWANRRGAFAPTGAPKDPPVGALEKLQETTNAARAAGEPVPSVGIASGDIGLTAIERGLRAKDGVPFEVNDQRLRDAALGNVTGLVDNKARPLAARELVEADVAAQRAEADAPIRVAYDEKAAMEAENARRLAEADARKTQTLNTQDAEVAALRAKADEAAQAEVDLGGTVTAQGGDMAVGDASKRVAAAVSTAKEAAESKKAGLYREAETLGKDTKIDPTSLADDARQLREDISRLSDPSGRLNNILVDLERLAPEGAKAVDTGLLDAAGKPITRPAVPESISVTDLLAMRPRLADASAAARIAKRGDVRDRLKQINDGIVKRLNELADAGDPAALKWREADDNFTTEFALDYRQGVGKALDRAERRDSPVVGTAVAGEFLYKGAGSKEAAADLRRILSGAETEQAGLQAAREYVLADMARLVGADGKVGERGLRRWISDREGMLGEIPGLRGEVDKLLTDVVGKKGATTKLQQELEQATTLRKKTERELTDEIRAIERNGKLSEKQKAAQIETLRVKQQEVETQIKKNAASLLLDADPKIAARDVFSARDPVKAMSEIVAKVSKDKDALAGWKRAVTEHLVDKVTGTNAAVGNGVTGPVTVAELKTFFDKNAGALAKVYDANEMNALRRSQKILEPLGNLRRQATVGSQTVENEALWKALDAGLLAVTGNAITAGMVMKRVRTVVGLLPNMDQDRAKLLQKVFLDPELAQHMLTRDVAQIKMPAWNTKLRRLLLGAETGREMSEPNAEK